MKRVALRLAGLLAALGVAGLLAAWLGLVPIAASTGHWTFTAWLLHFTMRQSVRTRALGIEVPALDDPAQVLRGAAHYDSGCAPCHGAPGVRPPAVGQRMTPHPPELPPLIGEWKARELFWIVKHGIKYTGMPAWVAQQRDDEVWAVVAFLQRLPGMRRGEYRRLASGESHAHGGSGEERGRGSEHMQSPADAALHRCAQCHGHDGAGRGERAFPRLAGQSEIYLYAALDAYARGTRYSGFMQPQVVGLSDSTLRELAAHYAAQPVGAMSVRAGGDASALERGEDIARRGAARDGIPSCVDCHGPAETPRSPYYPTLAGQHANYLRQQLELFRDGRRGGSPYSPIMHAAAHRLEPRQIRDVSRYYESLARRSRR